MAVDLADIRRGRTRDGDPTRLHDLGQLADQLELPEAMAHAKAIGADRVELYTESYAHAHGTPQGAEVLAGFIATAQAALREGLGINAGHDLNRDNLTDFLRAVPGILEVSIGHALIADALELGYTETVRDYLRCIHVAAVPAA